IMMNSEGTSQASAANAQLANAPSPLDGDMAQNSTPTLAPMEGTNHPSNSGGSKTIPKLTSTTDFTVWRNIVECMLGICENTFLQNVFLIIGAMDEATHYRAQNIVSDVYKTAKDLGPSESINNLTEFFDRLDRTLNKVGETDRARMKLESIRQRKHESLADYYQECYNLWVRSTKGMMNPPESPLINYFISGLENRTVAYLARIKIRESSTRLEANQAYRIVCNIDLSIKEEDLEFKKKAGTSNRDLIEDLRLEKQRELQALHCRQDEPMEIDSLRQATGSTSSNQTNNARQSTTKKSCLIHPDAGHSTEECIVVKQQRNKYLQKPQRDPGTSRNNGKSNNHQYNVKCTNCNKMGHLGKDCRKLRVNSKPPQTKNN
ncbi:Hypothetical protein FKW44_009380, partial [Caligus rogercresseyi]